MKLAVALTLLPYLINAAPLGIAIALPSPSAKPIVDVNVKSPSSGLVNLSALAGVVVLPGAAQIGKVIPSVLPAVPGAPAGNDASRLAATPDTGLPNIGTLPNVGTGLPNIGTGLPTTGLPSGTDLTKVLPNAGTEAGKVLTTIGGTSLSLSPALDRLSTFISGLSAPSTADALKQLTTVVADLQKASNEQIAAIYGQVDIERVVAYIIALVTNLSIYLNSLPNFVLADDGLKAAAANVDGLVAAYIKGLQVIGLSTIQFAELAQKQGASSSGISPLLAKTLAIFPKA